jgi:hypothetical protein
LVFIADIVIEVAANETKIVECGPNANPFLSVVFVTFLRKRYIWVRVERLEKPPVGKVGLGKAGLTRRASDVPGRPRGSQSIKNAFVRGALPRSELLLGRINEEPESRFRKS